MVSSSHRWGGCSGPPSRRGSAWGNQGLFSLPGCLPPSPPVAVTVADRVPTQVAVPVLVGEGVDEMLAVVVFPAAFVRLLVLSCKGGQRGPVVGGGNSRDPGSFPLPATTPTLNSSVVLRTTGWTSQCGTRGGGAGSALAFSQEGLCHSERPLCPQRALRSPPFGTAATRAWLCALPSRSRGLPPGTTVPGKLRRVPPYGTPRHKTEVMTERPLQAQGSWPGSASLFRGRPPEGCGQEAPGAAGRAGLEL